MSTVITKEYVEGGMNIITTTTEFVPTDVVQSRTILAQQDLENAQTAFDEINSDLNAII